MKTLTVKRFSAQCPTDESWLRYILKSHFALITLVRNVTQLAGEVAFNPVEYTHSANPSFIQVDNLNAIEFACLHKLL